MTLLAITAIDFIKPVFFLILGLVMIFSPRTLMRKAKYDEDSMRTESWVKKLGVILCLVAIGMAVYYILEMTNA